MHSTDHGHRRLWTTLARTVRPTYGARANAADGLEELRRATAGRRTQTQQCRSCRRHAALQVVEHPAGAVVLCRFCGTATRPDMWSLSSV